MPQPRHRLCVTHGDCVIDKDRIRGSVKQIVGSIKEVVGAALGDKKTQEDGRAEQIAGKTQNNIGSLKDTVREKLKH